MTTLTMHDLTARVLDHYPDEDRLSDTLTLDPVLAAIILEVVRYLIKRCEDRESITVSGIRGWIARRIVARRATRQFRRHDAALFERKLDPRKLGEAVVEAGRQSQPDDWNNLDHMLV